MGMEFEVKFQATASLQEQLLSLSDQWQTTAMETTYYDTPSRALSHRKITLRRRLENGMSICTIKNPAEHNCRGEWEVDAENIQQAIPMLCKLGAPEEIEQLTAEGVVPLCGACFTRRSAQLQQGESILELALDNGILYAGSRQTPLCEIEAELKSGNQLDVLAFCEILTRRYDLKIEPQSKFRRALALLDGEEK